MSQENMIVPSDMREANPRKTMNAPIKADQTYKHLSHKAKGVQRISPEQNLAVALDLEFREVLVTLDARSDRVWRCDHTRASTCGRAGRCWSVPNVFREERRSDERSAGHSQQREAQRRNHWERHCRTVRGQEVRLLAQTRDNFGS